MKIPNPADHFSVASIKRKAQRQLSLGRLTQKVSVMRAAWRMATSEKCWRATEFLLERRYGFHVPQSEGEEVPREVTWRETGPGERIEKDPVEADLDEG